MKEKITLRDKIGAYLRIPLAAGIHGIKKPFRLSAI